MSADTESDPPLRVVELTVENVKRVRAVQIRPQGDVVIIGGRNAQGKSSVIDGLEMALGGGKSIPLEPVRHGARKARIVADLGEIVVERTFTAKGTELVVRGKDGEAKASPQKLLDTLCARVTFDPFEFSRLDPKKQDEVLKRLLELDFTDIEAARAKAYAQRTDANKELKRLEAQLDAMPTVALAQTTLIDVKETAAELKRRNAHNADRRIAEGRIGVARRDLAEHDQATEQLRQREATLTEELARLRVQIESDAKQRETMLASILKSEQELPPEESTADIEEQLAKADEVNGKVRANAKRQELEAQLVEQCKVVDDLSATIESLDEEKAERLAAAKFPIPGLGFDDAGPALDGVPLAQASSAQKLRVSVAIGAALNPRVKVMLVREGSLLDEDSMRLLGELAKETDSQVWVERVGTKDPSAVIIEDGSVLEGAEAAAE